MRTLLALGLGAVVALALPGGAHAQQAPAGPPRAGDTILLCADGGWDVPGGTCAGRGGVIGQQVYGSGVDSRASINGGFQVQPNAITGGAAANPGSNPPPRCGWANPCDSGE